MSDRVLVDAGPLVALLRGDDSRHHDAVVQALQLTYPFYSSWAVVTEAAWLLRNVTNGLDRLLEYIESGLLVPIDVPRTSMPWIRAYAARYGSLRPQVADLSLCWLAESEGIDVIFTFDRRDLNVYRKSDGRPFEIVPR
jgi:predicted nucleic acid-binding protein